MQIHIRLLRCFSCIRYVFEMILRVEWSSPCCFCVRSWFGFLCGASGLFVSCFESLATFSRQRRADSANAVSIGASGADASAVLDVVSTTKGFLFPRMTETQRTAIGTPATGLMVYQTDGDEGVYINKSFGWVQVI